MYTPFYISYRVVIKFFNCSFVSNKNKYYDDDGTEFLLVYRFVQKNILLNKGILKSKKRAGSLFFWY